MNKLLSVIVAAVFTAASMTAIAQEKKTEKPKAEKPMKKEPTAAQKKQKECAMQADDKKLKGDERKKFMSTCAPKPAAKKTDAKPMKAEPKK
jgi:Ni/Co efflux regulator RcnB